MAYKMNIRGHILGHISSSVRNNGARKKLKKMIRGGGTKDLQFYLNFNDSLDAFATKSLLICLPVSYRLVELVLRNREDSDKKKFTGRLM